MRIGGAFKEMLQKLGGDCFLFFFNGTRTYKLADKMVYFEAAEASSGLFGLALAASIHAPHGGGGVRGGGP